jgi:hypothetical protein
MTDAARRTVSEEEKRYVDETARAALTGFISSGLLTEFNPRSLESFPGLAYQLATRMWETRRNYFQGEDEVRLEATPPPPPKPQLLKPEVRVVVKEAEPTRKEEVPAAEKPKRGRKKVEIASKVWPATTVAATPPAQPEVAQKVVAVSTRATSMPSESIVEKIVIGATKGKRGPKPKKRLEGGVTRANSAPVELNLD